VPYAAFWILKVIDWAAVPVGLFAFLHALSQRPDAYTAAERLTKPAWLGITAGATVAVWLFSFVGYGWPFWMAGLVAALVYIVDVRPKLIEVQRGQKW
jgi:predicted MFS family arabinose efflux permease